MFRLNSNLKNKQPVSNDHTADISTYFVVTCLSKLHPGCSAHICCGYCREYSPSSVWQNILFDWPWRRMKGDFLQQFTERTELKNNSSQSEARSLENSRSNSTLKPLPLGVLISHVNLVTHASARRTLIAVERSFLAPKLLSWFWNVSRIGLVQCTRVHELRQRRFSNHNNALLSVAESNMIQAFKNSSAMFLSLHQRCECCDVTSPTTKDWYSL